MYQQKMNRIFIELCTINFYFFIQQIVFAGWLFIIIHNISPWLNAEFMRRRYFFIYSHKNI